MSLLRNAIWSTQYDVLRKECWENWERNYKGMPMEWKLKILLFSLARQNYRKGEQNASSTVKDEDGNLLVDDSEVRQRWKHYFATLY